MSIAPTIPSPETTTVVSHNSNSEARIANAAAAHAVPAREEIRMGRAATVSDGLNWITVTTIIVFHVGALAALFFFSWQRLLVMAVLYVLAINVGIGMCYHRLLTHRGYHTPKWVEYVMSIFATTSLEGGPIFWVSTHRVHHQLSDQEGDPHTPREGGWWAHAGWILLAKRCTRRLRCWHATRPILAAIDSTFG